MHEKRVPPQQRLLQYEEVPQFAEYVVRFLTTSFEKASADPSSIQKILELGCGKGLYTEASLQVFPNATIHSIDYHDYLHPQVRANNRVIFHQGFFTEVLEKKKDILTGIDLLLLNDISRYHGFNEKNISLLFALLKNDALIFLQGDNGDLPRFLPKMHVVGYYDRETVLFQINSPETPSD